jgi:4a-hydroxytetrahydrobiopterin dehydratase
MDGLKTLAEKKCMPCKGGTPPLKGAGLASLHGQLGHDWKVIREHQLEKEFKFKNFAQALEFTNRIGAVAEAEDHHPDIFLAWGKVGITLWTHSIDGLAEGDFVMAAKIESLPRPA